MSDHLIDADTAAHVAERFIARDGSVDDLGLITHVTEVESTVDGRVAVLGFDWQRMRKAPADAPFGHLEAAPQFEVPEGQRVGVRIVTREAPEGELRRSILNRAWVNASGLELVAIHWGDVERWEPAQPADGGSAVLTMSPSLAITLARPESIVPSVPAAMRVLADAGEVPGGSAGQHARAAGHTYPSVPHVAGWEDPGAEAWVLSALLNRAIDPVANPDQASLLGQPHPRITTLVDGGAPVILAAPGNAFHSGVDDRLLTLWQGLDREGRPSAVAVHRSVGAATAEALPLWDGHAQQRGKGLWAGELVATTAADSDEVEYRSKLLATRVGRLHVPSQQLVASDPCIAGHTPRLGMRTASSGPFPVLRLDLAYVNEEGTVRDETLRGILLVLDEQDAPVRWEPAVDDHGQAIALSIDTGMLMIADADAAQVVQQRRDEGTLEYSVSPRLALHRSDPTGPADIAELSDLGGDGPAWVTVGRSAGGAVVAVLVANFDPIAEDGVTG